MLSIQDAVMKMKEKKKEENDENDEKEEIHDENEIKLFHEIQKSYLEKLDFMKKELLG